MLAVVDGVVRPADEATIPALDRSAWYGDAAFETFRTHGRRVFALDARIARLLRSLTILGIATEGIAAHALRDLRLGLSRSAEPDAYVRLAVSRGAGKGGLAPHGDEEPRVSVFIGPLPSFPARYRTHGLTAITQASGLATHGSRSRGAKLASYVEPMLAAREARASGADDAIGLDETGVVLEATTSNLFAWIDGRWITPPLALGILPGITRETVLGLVSVTERILTVRDLARADEIVLTSSIRGLVPVTRLDGRPVGAGIVGTSFTALARAYDARVSDEASLVDAPPDSR